MTSFRQVGEGRVVQVVVPGWGVVVGSAYPRGDPRWACTKRDRGRLVRPLLTPLVGEACDSPLHMGTLSCGVLFPPQENARGHSRPRVWKRALPPPPLGNPSRIPNLTYRRFPLPPHWAEMTVDAKQRWILGWRAGLRRVSLGVGRVGDAVFVWARNASDALDRLPTEPMAELH
jgi:hypothetical protein